MPSCLELDYNEHQHGRRTPTLTGILTASHQCPKEWVYYTLSYMPGLFSDKIYDVGCK